MDNRSLHQLEQFSAFIDFLTNPAEHKKLLADLKKASVEYNTEAENIRATKEFQVWRNEQLAKLEAKERENAAFKEDITAKAEKALADIEEKYRAVDLLKQEELKKQEILDGKLKELDKIQSEKAELEKKLEWFANEQAKHQTLVDEFNRKAAAFAALMKE